MDGFTRKQLSLVVSIPKRDFIGFKLSQVNSQIEEIVVSIPKRDFIGFKLSRVFSMQKVVLFQSLKGIL